MPSVFPQKAAKRPHKFKMCERSLPTAQDLERGTVNFLMSYIKQIHLGGAVNINESEILRSAPTAPVHISNATKRRLSNFPRVLFTTGQVPLVGSVMAKVSGISLFRVDRTHPGSCRQTNNPSRLEDI